MNEKQNDSDITSKEELIYNIVMLVVVLGVVYGFSQLDSYKVKKSQQTQYQKIERITKTR